MSAPPLRTLIVSSPELRAHAPGPGHPEAPARVDAALAGIAQAHHPALITVSPEPVSQALLERVHAPGYIAALRALSGMSASLDPDTFLSPPSVQAALLAAGAGPTAVSALLRGQADNAFVVTRPPGHHAVRDHAMGFCIFNNIALAAEHALTLGIRRVLIVDWDLHHGNGTEAHFYERSDVLVFSAHRAPPFYPGTGALRDQGRGAGRSFTVNAPLPAGMGDADFIALFERVLTPIADQFDPELILVSVGYDAHAADPLSDQRLSTQGFAHLTHHVLQLATRHAQGRVALLLEGGYDLDALRESVAASVHALSGAPPPALAAPVPSVVGAQTIDQICEVHARFWHGLT